ncbi:hypothetical protein N8I77_005476 [Diaporthe amygdali]|uniref:Uncharacterized protein n=1 Tax=Phomopsis amygdali TaxID=1214568 RepID=A0AAD9W5M4_PHOAM|nr:hypothetical protein N8I77_005476 [Diaporthe amygdali]
MLVSIDYTESDSYDSLCLGPVHTIEREEQPTSGRPPHPDFLYTEVPLQIPAVIAAPALRYSWE